MRLLHFCLVALLVDIGVVESNFDYGYFFPYGKFYDHPLVDPPHYVFAEHDETNGLFYHTFSNNFPLFNTKDIHDVFISVNGYLSFNVPLAHPQAVHLPLAEPYPLLSLYHSDLTFTTDPKSHLSYKEYTLEHADEIDLEMLYRAKFEIEEYGGQTGFYPKRVFVVTWSNAYKSIGFGRATFQIVLATDGHDTYAIFNYRDLYLRGAGKPENFCPVTIGWNEDRKNHAFKHPNMQLYPSIESGEYRPLRMQRETNVRIPGKWIYHLHQNKIEGGPETPTPIHPGKPVTLPAECPGQEFCEYKSGLIEWPGYPGFFVSCSSTAKPVCMACALGTVFNSKCGICDHPGTTHKCVEPDRPRNNNVEQDHICNNNDAKQVCKIRGVAYARHRNYNDITGVSFYHCASIFGSFCTRCAPGTVFRQYDNNKNEGLCVHAYMARHQYWYYEK